MYMKLKYIGETIVDLHYGEVYEAKKTYDSALKDCYSIRDGSGDYYLYGEDYVLKNFEIIND